MEDFRNKIKNHKSTPTDESWEKMLIKKEKKSIKKTKTYLGGFLVINLIGFAFLAYQFLSNPADTNADSTIGALNEIKEVEVQENSKKEEITQEVDIQKFLRSIETLTTENNDLNAKLSSLQSNLLALRLNNASLKKEIDKLRSISFIQESKYNELKSLALNKNVEAKEVTLSQEIELNSTITGLAPLYNNKNSNVERFLVEMASQQNPVVPIFVNSPLAQNNKIRNWYISLGTTYEDIHKADRQRNFSIGIHRSVNRFFDVGIRYNYFNYREKSVFRESSEIKDQRLISTARLFVRYKALRFNKLLIHLDGGIQYRYDVDRKRRSRVVENQLQFYSETRDWNSFTPRFGLGIMYELNSKFTLGSMHYLDGNSFPDINVIYKF